VSCQLWRRLIAAAERPLHRHGVEPAAMSEATAQLGVADAGLQCRLANNKTPQA
jgi:hypothetical protein